MLDFISDLDDYFSKTYASYDQICTLQGYKMPKRQTSEVRGGKTYAYTLPQDLLKLDHQENKEKMLVELKEKLSDKTFSFTFYTVSVWQKLKYHNFYKEAKKTFALFLQKYQVTEEEVQNLLEIDLEIWRKIVKGKFMPSKNLLLSLCMAVHFSVTDAETLLEAFDCAFDYALAKDVVVKYLLEQKVYNEELRNAALAEYKVRHLFLR